MRPSRHLALSTVAGGVVWASTGEPWTLPVTVAVGVGLDIDHAPDMWWTFALERKPVAVFALHAWECGLYQAREYGVRSAMPMRTATRVCPELVRVSPRFDRYRQVSAQIMAIFREATP